MKRIANNLQISITLQLIEIQEITKLCAFAAEARRILADISVAGEVDDALDDLLGELTTANNGWMEYEDNLGAVLKNVDHRLQAIIDQVKKAEATHAIRS